MNKLSCVITIVLLIAITQQSYGRSPSSDLLLATQNREAAEIAYEKANIEFQNARYYRDQVAEKAKINGCPPPYEMPELEQKVNQARAAYFRTKDTLEQAKKIEQECNDKARVKDLQNQEDADSARREQNLEIEKEFARIRATIVQIHRMNSAKSQQFIDRLDRELNPQKYKSWWW